MFSSGFSEGQTRDINEGFPSDTLPYTDSYNYLSDSDLEDDETELSSDDWQSDSRPALTVSHPSQRTSEVENDHRSALDPVKPYNPPANLCNRPGDGFLTTRKVAVIRDVAAVTYVKPDIDYSHTHTLRTCNSFEAMICFLYTGNITFSPFSSDSRDELSTEASNGDGTNVKLPSPSAKSIYRLADKVISLICVCRPLAYRRR